MKKMIAGFGCGVVLFWGVFPYFLYSGFHKWADRGQLFGVLNLLFSGLGYEWSRAAGVDSRNVRFQDIVGGGPTPAVRPRGGVRVRACCEPIGRFVGANRGKELF